MSEKKYEKGSWSLADLIDAPSGAPMEEAFSNLEAAVADVEGRRDSLSAK